MDSRFIENGAEIVFAFETEETINKKCELFLAGTTPWYSDLTEDSWRHEFITQFRKRDEIYDGLVIYIPEPCHGQFDSSASGLIEWETKKLQSSNIHAYWLNTYWSFENAIGGCTAESLKFFVDGDKSNIGVTVRSEIGASFSRLKYQKGMFSLL